MAWVLLKALSQIYSENQKQKQMWRVCNFTRKEASEKLRTKREWLLKKWLTVLNVLSMIKNDSCIKNKPSTLYQDNGKYDFKTLKELAWLLPLQAQGQKPVNIFERLYFEKRAPECPAHWRPQREVFPQCHPSRHSRLLLQLAADLGVIHVVLVLQACRMREL